MPSIRTELKIFRGTYEEVMSRKTENMVIYLAWDTQEIFVGNSYGVKVPYGSPKDIKAEIGKYFSEFKNEIYSAVRDYSEQVVDDELKSSLDTFDKKYEKILKDLRNEVNTAFSNQIASLENTIQLTGNTVKRLDTNMTDVTSRLSSQETAVSELSTTTKSLEQEISLKQDALENGVTIKTINGESILGSGNIEIKQEDISLDGYYTSEEVDNKFKDYYMTNELDSKFESYYTSSEIDKKFEEFKPEAGESTESSILYLKGSEMVPTLDAADMTLIFCTENGNGFVLGSLYYFVNKQFKRISGGAVEKFKYTTSLGLSITPSQTSYEISNKDQLLTITTSATNSNLGGALSSNVETKVDGATVSSLTKDNSATSLYSVSTTKAISLRAVKDYSISLSYTALADDEENDYTVSGGSTTTISIYAPEFILVDGVEFKKSKTLLSEEKITIKKGSYIKILTNRNLSGFTMSGFNFPNYTTSSEAYTVNGVSHTYKSYLLGPFDSGVTEIDLGIK